MNIIYAYGCGHVGKTVKGKDVEAFIRVAEIRGARIVHAEGKCAHCKHGR